MEELTAIKTLAQSATLAEDGKRAVLWCLQQLPPLYDKLFQTYDNRFREEILRLEQAVVRPFHKHHKTVADAIRGQLDALHSRIGFEGLHRHAA